MFCFSNKKQIIDTLEYNLDNSKKQLVYFENLASKYPERTEEFSECLPKYKEMIELLEELIKKV